MATETDPLAHVREGDPDPTDWTGPYCNVRDPYKVYICTRKPQHPGQHIAGGDMGVYAVWL